MYLLSGHDFCVAINTGMFDLCDARRAVGFEDEAEQSRHEVVEFLAVVWIGMIAALGAGVEAVLDTAASHGAPGRFRVLVAPLAFPFGVGVTRAAIKSAIGDQLGFCQSLGHVGISSDENNNASTGGRNGKPMAVSSCKPMNTGIFNSMTGEPISMRLSGHALADRQLTRLAGLVCGPLRHLARTPADQPPGANAALTAP